MKTRLLISIFFILILQFLPLIAQEKFITDYKIAAWFGFRYTDRDSFANNENLDFLNYMVSYPEEGTPEYEYLGFSARLWFRNNWQADINIAMFDEFAPNNLNITAQYMPLKNIGITIGFYSQPLLVNDWPAYHKINDEGFYGDANRGFRQRYIHEYGIIAGPVIQLDWRFLHFYGKLNAGLSNIGRFEETVRDKKMFSNQVIEYLYETGHSPSFFIMPEGELSFDLFRLKNTKCGFQIQAAGYSSSRSLDYTRTTWTWMRENPLKEEIDNPLHRIRKMEMDAGIYFTF